MHECPDCGQACDCDGEDMWFDCYLECSCNCWAEEEDDYGDFYEDDEI